MRRRCRIAKIIQKSERPNIIEEELNRLFPAEWLRETAKETGFVKRDRKIDLAIPVYRLDAEDISVLYSARWEIELIFKKLKSRYGLDILPTSNPRVVEALLWVGILTLIVSRRVYCLVFSANLENA
ncbi:MAG: transposase, partial [Methanosarcinaceae archaeon]|nr:transposase [Methanosarcinaceae archaeon]